ncbi:MAG: pyridoxal phosphate-dependent aminotransferase [Candidatus Thorarchaeota archaeon]|jgi:aspartate/methionine/tyrosine aminotransferase
MVKLARGLDQFPQKPIYVLLSLARESGMVNLGVGEPNFDAPKEAIDAAINSLKSGETHYTRDPGTMQMREAILEKTKRDNDFDFDPETEIIVTAGSSAALLGTILATVETGDEVIVPAPSYLAYEPVIKFAGARPIFVPATEENDFIPTTEDIASVVTPRTKAMIVCSPNNPTGAVWSKSNLRGVADLALDHGFHVISDELYERILFDGNKAQSIASFDDMQEHAITLNGVSKSYAMTGFRVGWVIGSARVIDAYRKIHQYTAICASSTSQAASTVALNECEYHIQEMVSEYDRRRKLLLDRINNHIPLMSVTRPKGSFYMFVNVKELVDKYQKEMLEYLRSEKSKSFYEKLPDVGKQWVSKGDSGSKTSMLYMVAKAKTLTAPGIAFGPVGENFVRVSFAQEYGLIENALNNMQEVLEPWG